MQRATATNFIVSRKKHVSLLIHTRIALWLSEARMQTKLLRNLTTYRRLILASPIGALIYI